MGIHAEGRAGARRAINHLKGTFLISRAMKARWEGCPTQRAEAVEVTLKCNN